MEYLNNIKRYREFYHWSQKELADGICSQGMISKIEQGLVCPDIDIVIKLANKFEISVSQLLGESATGYLLDSVKAEIRQLNQRRQFDRLQAYLSEVGFNNLTYPQEFKCWVYAVIEYELHGNTDKALALLQEAYQLKSKKSRVHHFKVIVALASIYTEIGKLQRALEYFQEAYVIYNSNPLDFYLKRKFLYNMSRCYLKLDKIDQALYYCQMAIQDISHDDHLTFADHLHLLLTHIYLRANNLQLAQKALMKTKLLMEIKPNQLMQPFIEFTQLRMELLQNKDR
ncbi:helix-turn-helix domain-containing protein [Ignavigranum ruoffiae]|uniref:TPR repeat-containing protein n=1 Tax=Ignavigranum ruoffiae TaxID=89093 RepID=A0A1H9DF78_9LACT|nr:helix-turn-helix domain-containing protein [Ignavigranum ruoffiae]UPQ86259.1 helix-turn-helix transcriptional regulator [Ignavigranum ruoffiae]SEQ12162.1 TPR repeat-containing protein [Ignavigranum ruoffiae]